tara:strand:- start:2030 stop:2722 length:693 start_codon:yes stop_codon:yes gene_type:complete
MEAATPNAQPAQKDNTMMVREVARAANAYPIHVTPSPTQCVSKKVTASIVDAKQERTKKVMPVSKTKSAKPIRVKDREHVVFKKVHSHVNVTPATKALSAMSVIPTVATIQMEKARVHKISVIPTPAKSPPDNSVAWNKAKPNVNATPVHTMKAENVSQTRRATQTPAMDTVSAKNLTTTSLVYVIKDTRGRFATNVMRQRATTPMGMVPALMIPASPIPVHKPIAQTAL